MIQITTQMRELVAIELVDGKGIHSLARLCQDKLAEDSFSGCVFAGALRKGSKSVVPLPDRAIGNLPQWLIGPITA